MQLLNDEWIATLFDGVAMSLENMKATAEFAWTRKKEVLGHTCCKAEINICKVPEQTDSWTCPLRILASASRFIQQAWSGNNVLEQIDFEFSELENWKTVCNQAGNGEAAWLRPFDPDKPVDDLDGDFIKVRFAPGLAGSEYVPPNAAAPKHPEPLPKSAALPEAVPAPGENEKPPSPAKPARKPAGHSSAAVAPPRDPPGRKACPAIESTPSKACPAISNRLRCARSITAQLTELAQKREAASDAASARRSGMNTFETGKNKARDLKIDYTCRFQKAHGKSPYLGHWGRFCHLLGEAAKACTALRDEPLQGCEHCATLYHEALAKMGYEYSQTSDASAAPGCSLGGDAMAMSLDASRDSAADPGLGMSLASSSKMMAVESGSASAADPALDMSLASSSKMMSSQASSMSLGSSHITGGPPVAEDGLAMSLGSMVSQPSSPARSLDVDDMAMTLDSSVGSAGPVIPDAWRKQRRPRLQDTKSIIEHDYPFFKFVRSDAEKYELQCTLCSASPLCRTNCTFICLKTNLKGAKQHLTKQCHLNVIAGRQTALAACPQAPSQGTKETGKESSVRSLPAVPQAPSQGMPNAGKEAIKDGCDSSATSISAIPQSRSCTGQRTMVPVGSSEASLATSISQL